LMVMVAVVVVGCRKGDRKPLTPIPENAGLNGNMDNDPAGNIMNGSGNGLNGAGQLGNNEFPQGQNLSDGGSTGLPSDPDRFAGKDETRLEEFTVYFGFDRYTVNATEMPKITSIAEILKDKPSYLLRIEGHCDERGTEEYNRSLGERRALSVRDVLVNEGIDPARITTESWGEDRAAVEGDGESAFSKNRRGEFVVLQ